MKKKIMNKKAVIFIFLFWGISCFCLIFFAPFFNIRIHYSLEQGYLLGSLVVISLFWGMKLLNKAIKRDGELLSGSYIAIHKFFIPLLFLCCFIADNLLLILGWFRAAILPLYIMAVPILCFSLIWWICVFFPAKTLYYTKNTVLFCDFFSCDYTYSLSSLEKIECLNTGIYRIKIKGAKRLTYKIFVPPLYSVIWRNERTRFDDLFNGFIKNNEVNNSNKSY